jgi:hypothetical protein
MENTIDECLDRDIEATLKIAAELRNAHFMRVTPQVIMVRAAMHPNVLETGLIRQYAPHILRRGDEPATQLAYFFSEYGQNGRRGRTAIPGRLRKAWKACLEGLDDYQLSKYKLEGRNVKTIDVVRLVHAHSPSIDKLVNGTLSQTGRTWNAITSEQGSSEDSWRQALEVMPHMALLRNVRNLLQNNIQPADFSDKLLGGVERGKQLPFRYYSAYRAVVGDSSIGTGKAATLDALEACLMKSFSNLPKFEGRTMSLCDNSGSADGAFTSDYGSMTVAQIGNLMAVVTAYASDEGHVGVFGDELETLAVRKRSSIFDTVDRVNSTGVGQATENGIWLFWNQAISNKEHWDNVFVYSDMQAGHGGLYGTDRRAYGDYIFPGTPNSIDVPKLIARYRQEVNPNVQVFLIQTAGYQDALVPEFYKGTYILGGWSDKVLHFADAMSNLTK